MCKRSRRDDSSSVFWLRGDGSALSRAHRRAHAARACVRAPRSYAVMCRKMYLASKLEEDVADGEAEDEDESADEGDDDAASLRRRYEKALAKYKTSMGEAKQLRVQLKAAESEKASMAKAHAEQMQKMQTDLDGMEGWKVRLHTNRRVELEHP